MIKIPQKNQPWLWLTVSAISLAIGIPLLLYLTDDSLKSTKLADGTKAFYFRGSEITVAPNYPNPREIRVDGDIFFQVSKGSQPLTIRSKLLVLTVTGRSAFRIMAYSEKNGEQVDVLYGNVTAQKSYDSPFDESAELVGGQMVMINSTIDLMEKEKLGDDEVPLWVQNIMAKKSKPSHKP